MPQPYPIPESHTAKAKLIVALMETRCRILEVARALPPSLQDKVFLGMWSPKDLLAHLIGWDLTNIEAAGEVLEGRLPSFYAHHDRDWQAYNALLVQRHKKADYGDLLEDAVYSHRCLMERVESIPAQELEHDRGITFRGWRVTIERLLWAEQKDEEEHWQQLKALAESGAA